jgi:signal transduction histidine kinase
VLNVSKLNLYDEFVEEEFDLKDLVSGVIKKRKSTADSHLMELKFIDERENQSKIAGDKFLLDIAISNLVGNSIKYGVDGGKIEVVLRNDDGSQMVEICDDGIGIPEDEIQKIFKDFYRGTNAKKVTIEGSGLGLSVVKKIVERHNGLIKVKSPSRLGKKDHPGACFTIKLPTVLKHKTNQ